MNTKYLSIFLMVLILSIGAVNAQENNSDEIVNLESDKEVLSVNEYVIQDSNYDLYFNDGGEILENSSLCDGDTLLIANVTNKVFNIDKNLNIESFSPQSLATNSTFIFKGINTSSINGLNINNENIPYAIYV